MARARGNNVPPRGRHEWLFALCFCGVCAVGFHASHAPPLPRFFACAPMLCALTQPLARPLRAREALKRALPLPHSKSPSTNPCKPQRSLTFTRFWTIALQCLPDPERSPSPPRLPRPVVASLMPLVPIASCLLAVSPSRAATLPKAPPPLLDPPTCARRLVLGSPLVPSTARTLAPGLPPTLLLPRGGQLAQHLTRPLPLTPLTSSATCRPHQPYRPWHMPPRQLLPVRPGVSPSGLPPLLSTLASSPAAPRPLVRTSRPRSAPSPPGPPKLPCLPCRLFLPLRGQPPNSRLRPQPFLLYFRMACRSPPLALSPRPSCRLPPIQPSRPSRWLPRARALWCSPGSQPP